jgi:peptidoglycan-associated lipoprotein
MKKNLLITTSLLVLAACANNSQDVDLTEQNLDIQPTQSSMQNGYSANDASAYSDAMAYDSIDASNLDEKTLQVRQDLAAIASNKVLFGFDSSAVSPEAQEQLTLIANFILSHDVVTTLIVQGHADERGTREYNLSLGERRAVAVKKYLVGLGLNSEKIETISFGKEQPADTAHTDAAWAKNRRAVILLDTK